MCSQDPEKMDAIRHFQRPVDRTGLKSFLGLCAQFSQWFPELSGSATKMRRLLCKDVVWDWGDEVNAEFERMRDLLSSP